MTGTRFASVDEYIDSFDGTVWARLTQTREIARRVLPDAEEVISYNVPAYRRDGVFVVYFAGFTHHTSLSFYPSANTYARFADELAGFKTSKSAIQLPLTEAYPADLVEAIIAFRRDEAAEHARSKRS